MARCTSAMNVPDAAFWIGSDHPFDLHEAYLNFRCDVVLASAPATAPLFISADSRYRLWINGTFVQAGPSRCWPHAQQVDEIDVAAHLTSGDNAIAVQVYSPGYSHFAYVHRGVHGLLAWLDCDGAATLVTDQGWRVQRDRSWREDVMRVSIYGSGVERRDMALVHDWETVDATSADWKVPRIVAPAQGGQWRQVMPRDVPLLRHKVLPLGAPALARRGGTGPGADDPHLALRALWQATAITPVPPSPVVLAAGETLIHVHDLGSSHICRGGIGIAGAAGGERVLISYAEKLRDGDVLLSDPETYCRMRPTDEFILRPGTQQVEGFTPRGGRFIIFAITAAAPCQLALTPSAHLTHYPLDWAAVRLPTEPQLHAIANMCLTTLRACLQDGFVDSVWRESSQWLGDCVAEAFALAAISDDLRPLRRAITMAAQGAYDDGVLPSVLPGEVHAYAVVDYNFSWVELLTLYADHARADDGRELVGEQMPVLQRMLERFDADCDADGLIRAQPGRRLFLDWSAVDRSEPSLTYNARYLYALDVATGLALDQRRAELAQRWSGRSHSLRAAMRTSFHTQGRWHENTQGTPASQLGLALLLLTKCAVAEDAGAVADAIVARSLDLRDDDAEGALILASPFMHHYVFLALETLGRHGDIMSIIRARWGRWAQSGEATTWENWAVDFPDGSVCHGFSAHPLGWIGRCLAAEKAN